MTYIRVLARKEMNEKDQVIVMSSEGGRPGRGSWCHDFRIDINKTQCTKYTFLDKLHLALHRTQRILDVNTYLYEQLLAGRPVLKF